MPEEVSQALAVFRTNMQRKRNGLHIFTCKWFEVQWFYWAVVRGLSVRLPLSCFYFVSSRFSCPFYECRGL